MNKIALVTGGSRGLGKDMAMRLAEYGHDVMITYHSKKAEADAVVRSVEEKGKKAASIQFDGNDVKGLDGFMLRVKETLKNRWTTDKFDFLVNNAGMGATLPFATVTEADFDSFLNVHFKSVYFLCQKSLPLMNDGGRIINISTGTTRIVVPGYSVYASMKGAIETFTKYLAKEVGQRKITVNVVAPGAIETDFNNGALRSNPERKAMMIAMTALGRTGQPEDIGGVVAFLCSQDAGWITGQRLEVSGGQAL